MIEVKPIDPDEDVTLICTRVSWIPTAVPSVMMACQECRESVWVSKATLASILKQASARLKTVCTVCVPPDSVDAYVTPETLGEAMRYG